MLKKVNNNQKTKNHLSLLKTKKINLPNESYSTSILVLRDMMYVIKIWRIIKGYSSNGQRSHSNNKGTKFNKKLLLYRVQQFYQLFGRKKRDIFPTLVVAEYTNRLWYLTWHIKWIEARLFSFKLALSSKRKAKFDPHLTAKNVVTGIPAIRKKKKHNAAKKKILLVITIGLPLQFTKYLYGNSVDEELPFELSIPDESRRKMGKKKKKK